VRLQQLATDSGRGRIAQHDLLEQQVFLRVVEAVGNCVM
jgi:hypothetical protein